MYNLLSHTVTGQSIRKAIDERVSYDDIRKGVTPVEGKRELNISDLDVNSPDPPVQEDLEHEFGTPLRYKEAEIKKMLTKKFVESLQNRMATIVDERNWMLLNDYNTKEIKVRYRITSNGETFRPFISAIFHLDLIRSRRRNGTFLITP
jgi:ketopantoate reductase